MAAEQAHTSDPDGAAPSTTSDEIAKSLGSVWQRFSGQRPKSTNVEMERDVVRCVIEENPPEAQLDEDDETPAEVDASRDPRRFDHDATAAVARVTGRRVIASIPKHDSKTQTSTQTFILDRPRQRF